ncbi:peptide chain release factor N(5)-glutamine methyltransferase [Flavobacterium stagni]|uniref:Release factor glutamine methyltransferase n=1 Tax=Flavobacterium stagni TaxID=2506421 RepID=A0A4Q1K9C2_9FLAO|nr:peptide chain release factor N(5)-glutamine methyltransferase [Flavobacterium stagni]RXR22468.1 peptide chain release factor N(5)-glutamine methyltransferase [Flavobacterium stagni]
MVLLQLKSQFLDRLTPLYDAEEVARFFELLLNAFESKKRIDLALDPELETQQLPRWYQAMEALERFEPIQYIIGETEFFGLPFEVTPATLIPRPETEELVEWILKDANAASLSILEIGTGSGCIPITLAKQLPHAQVTSIDVSTEALAVATRNAKRNAVNVQFIHQSVLETEALETCFADQFFDVIVSNPPYVRHLEKHEIQPNVLEHEPHLALFVEDDDALLFYRHIGQLAQNHLKKGGKLYFEINQYLGKETVALLNQLGFQGIELRKDLFGNDRMIRCER